MRSWKRAVSTTAMAAAAALFSVAGRAHADGGGEPGWIKETTDQGCYQFSSTIVYSGILQGQGAVWTGPCTPGQPINGEGTFYRQYRDGLILAYTGRIVNGFPHGPTHKVIYRSWPPSGAGQMRETIDFNMGCAFILPPACQPGSPSNVVEVPQVSPALFPLPSEDVSDTEESEVDPGTSPAPGSDQGSSSLVAIPASAKNGDVWGRCVALESLGRSGIQDMWQLRNKCQSRISLSYCLAADFEAAGDYNLCTRREHKTHSVAPGGTVHFSFNLMPPGTALTDGRQVTTNALSAYGFACANGNSPGVYFRDGQFLSTGC